jgi:glycosyltransferase involved in cell wall biosynthesis
MKVALVSHSADAGGGAELALCELVDALRARLVTDLHVVIPQEGPLRARLEGVGAEVTISRIRGWVRPAAAPRRLGHELAGHGRDTGALARIFRRLRPDVIVTNTVVSPTAAFAAAIVGIPHVWSIHEFGVRDHGFVFDFGRGRSLGVAARLSRRVTVSSRALYDDVAPWVGLEKLRLVRYAVELPPPSPRAASTTAACNLVLVGTKSPSKGQEEAIRALAMLRASGEQVRLRLVGGGDPRYVRTLERLALELRVAGSVEFVAETAAVIDHYSWADLVVVCSRDEAFGRVTVEAMKAGKPVIGARSGGTAELIREGENGLLYTPGEVAELAGAIRRLAHDRILAGRLAECGRGWASETFTSDRYGELFALVLEESAASCA